MQKRNGASTAQNFCFAPYLRRKEGFYGVRRKYGAKLSHEQTGLRRAPLPPAVSKTTLIYIIMMMMCGTIHLPEGMLHIVHHMRQQPSRPVYGTTKALHLTPSLHI